ncbi:MAG: DNA translocase FtsK [Bacteroidales bacterium]|nr:DNA translocase FtsK [Bacteroidales bacterium]
MAKTKNKKESDKKEKTKKKLTLDSRYKIIAGLVLVSVALVVFVSMVSYVFSWKSDQSLQWVPSFDNPELQADNLSGKWGASMSRYFISNWFGLASFSIPFIIFLVGIKLLRVKLLPFRRSFSIAVFSTLILSAWMGLATLKTPLLGSGLGGKHGYFVSIYIKSLIGSIGTVLLYTVVSFAFIVFTWPKLYYWLREYIRNRFSVQEHIDNSNVEVEISGQQPEEAESGEIDFVDEGDDSDLVFETEFPQHEKPFMPESFGIKSLESDPLMPYVENATENPAQQAENTKLTIENQQNIETNTTKLSNFPLEDYDPTLDLSGFQLPPVDLLEKHDSQNSSVTNEELISNKNKIVETLGHYKIKIDKIKATIGPTVTLYEIVPAPGVRISRIKNLEDDIALNLAALGIRIIAPIPGKGTIGIEVPNQQPEVVSMRSLLTSRKFQESKSELAIALGKTISNETYVFDLAKMPHLLVAGATGQGKSVGLNVILASLLYRKHPSQLKFVLIDPKKVELTLYQKIERHYLAKIPDADESIITDTQKVIYTLNSLCIEMDTRYDLLKKAQVRNIKEYNHKFIKRQLNPENGHKYLPYIVVIIDEFADLIMTAGREVETPLARLAQLARAIGIHLVIATQRPTTNIITGVIKANFPARVAFRVTSMIDSRTILDSPGANQLIGRGDMLFAPGSELIRLQCGFIDIPELERVTDFIGGQRAYPTPFYLPEYVGENGGDSLTDVDLSKRDALFDDAARLVVAHQQGSTSLIQRKFSIGYNRAGRIVDQLEAAGIVGPFEGSKARQVLFPDEYSLEQYLRSLQ